MRCDIIIPVYNAYEALEECLESVINSTDLTDNGLILVDDCSPDERIAKYLNEIKLKFNGKNITVLTNEQNRGFVFTVNRGMKHSNSDVLLLNSDTVVSEGWLEKIKKCAYSEEKVATVTPLSNNATLCSVPRPMVRNETRDDITLKEYNDLVEKCAYNDHPQLPTAHGFCVYIRREALDTVGFFDEATFGRGYGEENDFSYRATEFGFKNLMCDDTVVYHKESQSFSGERAKVIDAHMQILKNRYPFNTFNQDLWCRTYPLEYICKNIGYNLGLYNRKNILLLIHEWQGTVGGTTIHIKDLIKGLRKYYNFHVLYPSGDGYSVHSFFKDDEDVLKLPFRVQRFSRYTSYNKDYADMIDGVIRALGIDIVHVHHMLGHCFDVIDVAKKHSVKTVITLHDYYCICPTVNMLYMGEKYCMSLAEKNCKECLLCSNRATDDITYSWRGDFHKFLSKFDMVITPSEDTKQKILSVYNDIEITAVEHGVETVKEIYEPKKSDVFNVAFIGVMCIHKGGLIIDKIIKDCKHKNIKFHIFGSSVLPELGFDRGNLVLHGEYKREELTDLLRKNNIDLIGFFQIWPETYSYTLNEAVSAGIPVLTFDIGAGASRVKEHGLGWLLDVNTPVKNIVAEIKRISEFGLEYDEKLESIKNYDIKTVETMADEYKNFYDRLADSEHDVDMKTLREIIKDSLVSSGDDSGSRSALDEILSSAKWRIISKLRVPTFLKKPLKSAYKKINKH